MASQSDLNEIYLSSSPHAQVSRNTQKIMLTVILCLLPLCVYGIVLFGLSAAVTILVSTISCVVFELLFRKITKQPSRVKDLSAVVTGIMLALVLPPALPVWKIMLGALFAVVVAKEFFGGLGANVFNPALTGRAFLFLSFPVAMGTWQLPFDTVTGATPLAEGIGSQSNIQLFLGNRAGCIGESSILLITIAFVVLALTKTIDWRAPVAMVATTVGFEWMFGGSSGFLSGDPLFSLMTGGLLFGAVFMATDYATTPVTSAGRLIFGFGAGLITGLIRTFGGFPEGVMFSLLIMNILVPFLNRIIKRKYGYGPMNKKVV